MERRSLPLLATPAFTGAVAVLLLNDQFLKAAAPGWWTGKLSDVVGIVVIAVLARVVLRHDAPAIAVAAIGFLWLKAVPGAAVLAAPVLGGVTRQDPTDLFALVVLVPVAIWFRARASTSPAVRSRSGALQVIALVLAVLGTTATSCLESPEVDRLVVEGDTVWAGIRSWTYDFPDDERVSWARSQDGGRTWVRAEAGPRTSDSARPLEACAAIGTCWRVVPGERVDVIDGPDVRVAFTFTAEQWRRQERSTISPCDSPRLGTFSAVAVTGDPSRSVVVAMGRQGVLRYDGTHWSRVAVLASKPLPMPGPSWLVFVPIVLALIGGTATVVLAAYGRSIGHAGRRWRRAASIAASAAAAIFLVGGAMSFAFSRYYVVTAWVVLGIAIGAFVASCLALRHRPVSRLAPPPPPPPGPGRHWP